MIKAENLSKTYSKKKIETNVLKDVSIQIAEGEFVSIIGPSGSGKSTLLLMLGGMMSPTSGKIEVAGQPLYQLSTKDRALLRRKTMGFVFQQFNLVPYLSALENVQLPLLLAGCGSKQQKARAEELLTRVGLLDRMHHKPSELSVGQQQRIALARMLANDPALIFADEPTGNLDPVTGKIVMNLLTELNAEGKTIVMVTHDMEIANATKRRISINDGQIFEDQLLA